MERFWDRGALFVHDLIRDMDEPKPHYNTVSTIVRGLEEKGFVGHERFGTTYRYFPLLSREEFGRMSLQNAVGKYFNRSYLRIVHVRGGEENHSRGNQGTDPAGRSRISK